ncbi:MAG: TIGR03790 family protein [Opitutus sp.]|nr:TIGR03790 family protein [Opitutus sp.]
MKRAWLLLLLAGSALARAAVPDPALRVVLLANSDDPDSLRIARHYAEARGVPAANVIALKLPLTETITWSEFIVTLWQPLQEQLVRDKWIDAIPMALTDGVGRKNMPRPVTGSPRWSSAAACRSSSRTIRRFTPRRGRSRRRPNFAPTPARSIPS